MIKYGTSYSDEQIQGFFGDKGKLVIGEYCSIARGLKVLLGGEHQPQWVSTYPFTFFYPEYPWPPHKNSKGDIIIGNDVWIGMDVMILSGSTIGDGAVIGAGSVVRGSIPPYAIAYGNPAKVKKYRFSQETIDKLLEIKWWNWDLEKVKKFIPLIENDDVEAFIKVANES